MANAITRSTVNDSQYAAPEFQKSGFNLSHKRYSSFQLGKLHVSGFQWCMPGDKISGKNDGNFTFERIVTPMVSPVDVAQYNLFLPLRALDRTFERAMAPSKNNAMSAAWSAPAVSTSSLVRAIMDSTISPSAALPYEETLIFLYKKYVSVISEGAAANNIVMGIVDEWLDDDDVPAAFVGRTIWEFLFDGFTFNGADVKPLMQVIFDSMSPGGTVYNMAKALYIEDALPDIMENFKNRGLYPGTTAYNNNVPFAEFLYNFFDCLLTPWLGRYSYFGEFKYNYIRPSDLYKIAYRPELYPFITDHFSSLFDLTFLNEYPLRMMYVVWYERFRDVNLEPVCSTLPDWHDFGSTSIFDLANGGNICYLLYRFRNWYEDIFTGAQIDDLSRHVFAPILGSTVGSATYATDAENNLDANSSNSYDSNLPKPKTYKLAYHDQLSDSDLEISCPVPSNVNDVLSAVDRSFYDVYGLDLNTLRQSQQLEKYLKRNYLFGDEYQDRMLAHYNSRVSDMRVNKPEVLSQSLNGANMEQEIANVSTAQSNVGDRTATGTLQANGDGYTTFCEEFGILIHVISFMPRALYDGVCPQLLLSKQVDFPLPEFATNNEEFGRKMEIASSSLVMKADALAFMFGRYPAYHAWRSRVDEVGGKFLDELQDCTFRRFWGLEDSDSTPKLNYQFLHCRPNLGMFANTNMYDGQVYGDVVHECYVERVLPTPVEVI